MSTKTHLTDDGPKKCVAQSPETCTATCNGERAPHFETEEQAWEQMAKDKGVDAVSIVKSESGKRKRRVTGVTNYTTPVDEMSVDDVDSLEWTQNSLGDKVAGFTYWSKEDAEKTGIEAEPGYYVYSLSDPQNTVDHEFEGPYSTENEAGLKYEEKVEFLKDEDIDLDL